MDCLSLEIINVEKYFLYKILIIIDRLLVSWYDNTDKRRRVSTLTLELRVTLVHMSYLLGMPSSLYMWVDLGLAFFYALFN
jgi:hypothetical protein